VIIRCRVYRLLCVFFDRSSLLSDILFSLFLDQSMRMSVGYAIILIIFFRQKDRLMEMAKKSLRDHGTKKILRKGDIDDNGDGTIFFSTEE
jgi:hypothetical protein